jgi:hypothetical protein
MPFQWLIGWWNLLYIAPFFLALLYAGLYIATGIGMGDGVDHDTDSIGGGHIDVDSDAHLDTDGEFAVEGGADADLDGDGQLGPSAADLNLDADLDGHGHMIAAEQDGSSAETDQTSSHGLIKLFGFGQIPLTIALLSLMLSWGLIGFLVNILAWPRMPSGVGVVRVSIPIALTGSLICARLLSAIMGRWLPSFESYADRRHALIGNVGEAVFIINSQSGVVAVRDHHGDLFQVGCRVYEPDGVIPKGARVRLVAYNGKQGLYYGLLHQSDS